MNKKKIINDPVYGFINISSDILFDIIEHPYFQRLRRIRQLGLTNYVYPGSNHSRFQHAIGTLHLVSSAINVIRSKGHEITAEEEEGLNIALLLHDVGHGPFSHALEYNIMGNVNHELLSLYFMQEMNRSMNGRLSLAIDIFTDNYPKHFLHKLVSGQLDMDRLDYLNRDSFFTGVIEGTVGSDRIIKMLNVYNDQLVIDPKGIYSVEKFLFARRFMYWQVYLHKTVLAAEYLLFNILNRARELTGMGKKLFSPPSLLFFLKNRFDSAQFKAMNPQDRQRILDTFALIDDNDIITSVKAWAVEQDDIILSDLSSNLMYRRLPVLKIQNEPFEQTFINELKTKVSKKLDISLEETDYYVFGNCIYNKTYSNEDEQIKVIGKDGELKDISEVSEILDVNILSQISRKHFLCYPKNLNA